MLLPPRIRLTLAAGGLVAAIAGAWWAVTAIRESGRLQGRAEVQTRWQAERVLLIRTAEIAASAAQAETARRAAAQKEIVDDANRKISAADGARADADAAADRLRQRAAALAARCDRPRSDTAVAASSAPAAEPGAVLAELLSRLDQAAGQLAAAADARGIAGAACERAYDTLTTRSDR